MSLLNWLIARPVFAIVGVLAALWLIFNYQNISTVYLLGKYLVLLGAGIYSYLEIEKRIGKKMSAGTRTIIAVLSAIVLVYVLRQTFFLAFLVLILYFMFKGD